MPTYEYRCANCAHEFELFQQMSDPVKRKCPKCGKAKLERLIGTGAGVIFKGGGFYQTDYRSDSYNKAADADKKSGEPASAGSSSTQGSASPDGKTKETPPTAAKPDSTESKSARSRKRPKKE